MSAKRVAAFREWLESLTEGQRADLVEATRPWQTPEPAPMRPANPAPEPHQAANVAPTNGKVFRVPHPDECPNETGPIRKMLQDHQRAEDRKAGRVRSFPL
ncbi:MAG: hypothetical protein KDB90_14465 [Planctomycetes bacterium]|nr:hypothetical protein [Planctomycetota bacterium]